MESSNCALCRFCGVYSAEKFSQNLKRKLEKNINLKSRKLSEKRNKKKPNQVEGNVKGKF